MYVAWRHYNEGDTHYNEVNQVSITVLPTKREYRNPPKTRQKPAKPDKIPRIPRISVAIITFSKLY